MRRNGIGYTWWATHESAVRHAVRVSRIARGRVRVERFRVGRDGRHWRVSPTDAPPASRVGEPCS